MVYENKFTPILSFKGNLHFTNREFANKLPFENGGQVKLSRIFWGGRLMFINSSSLLKIPYYLSFGFELGDQKDKRQRYDNLEGTKGGKTFDQLEQFQNIAFFCKKRCFFEARMKQSHRKPRNCSQEFHRMLGHC